MDKLKLKNIVDFMQVTERMKTIYRTVDISTLERGESDAEHSWHVALFLMLLERDLPQDVDKLRLYKMLLTHDLVEVYAGDTAVYDNEGRKHKVERERRAAKKLFGQLPEELRVEFAELFREFEETRTVEAKIAKALDKLHPLLQNLCSQGTDYLKFKATYAGEKEQIDKHVDFNSTLQQVSDFLLEAGREKGYIT